MDRRDSRNHSSSNYRLHTGWGVGSASPRRAFGEKVAEMASAEASAEAVEAAATAVA
jgi:hypothetical protein